MIEFDFTNYRIKHWYPGHMLKAQRQIKEKLKLADAALILLDSRLPQASINPELDKILNNKARIYVLNKKDLAQKTITSSWEKHFRNEGHGVLSTNSVKKEGIKAVVPVVRQAVLADRKRRGVKRPMLGPIRLLIIGVPNVGKSSIINSLAGKKSAQTGPRPGVTRNQQWVKIANDVELLDTPGIMMPHGQTEETELKLALANIIRQDLPGYRIISQYLLYLLHRNGMHDALKRFKIESLPETVDELLTLVAKARGKIKTGGEVDIELAGEILIREFNEGRLGKISLESPKETVKNDQVTASWPVYDRSNSTKAKLMKIEKRQQNDSL